MTSFDVCSKISKSDDRHPQPLDAQSWYLCKKESLGIMFDKWKSKAFMTKPLPVPLPEATENSKADHVRPASCHVGKVSHVKCITLRVHHHVTDVMCREVSGVDYTYSLKPGQSFIFLAIYTFWVFSYNLRFRFIGYQVQCREMCCDISASIALH